MDAEAPPCPVLHRAGDYLAVAKPPGVLVIRGRGPLERPVLREEMEAWLAACGEPGRLWVVHRLDADTSGVVLFARTAAAHREANAAFERGLAAKSYLAVVEGDPPSDSGTIDLPVAPSRDAERMRVHEERGKPSRTEWRVLERYRPPGGPFALLEVRPRTGRRHQVRVHLAACRLPLAVDPVYGRRAALLLSDVEGGPAREGEPPLLERLSLHALRLEVPRRGRPSLAFEAPLPADLELLLAALRPCRILTQAAGPPALSGSTGTPAGS